ncbi:MAG TPA: CocE/NonD family hydrolase [Blastocatellia bacterium]|nr:CocE/NonD family hydrolase [Blastocatellia bacterium]
MTIQRIAVRRLAGGLCLLVVLALAVCPSARAQDAGGKPPQAQPEVDLLWGMKIPLRDGVKLNATVYKPRRMDAPLPVIFTLTPYIADTYHERAYYFARHGYVFALVDVRGRGSSEGKFDPFRQEARDGYDIVEWLAAQPWSNGKVTMWGGSYAGYNQWATAKEFPPHLATIVPAAAAFAGVDFPFFKNIWGPYDIQWLTYTSGVTGNGNLFGEGAFWTQKFFQIYSEHLPFSRLDEVTGNLTTTFQTWIAHPTPDAYWDAMVPSDEQFARINLPILTITGHYDGDQAGAMEYYKRHMRLATAAARDKHFLIIGPWDHAGTRTPRKEVGGLKFGDASLLDLNKLHREWYDWTMKGGPRPEFLKKPVAYYVAGAEEWKYADSLAAIASGRRTLYLDSAGGQAGDVFHSGTLSDTPATKSAPDRYVYDPLDTRPAELEREAGANYVTDQRYALNLFDNGLVYHSAPFAEATEVSGYLKFTAWMALDVPDTDFSVTVYEVMADGTSLQLTSDQLRARYRESLRQAKLVTPGAINRYDFDGFTFFSRRIARGSRLRLVISCPNSIYAQKNYNSGGAVEKESGKEARTAHVTLYHDSEHPSALEIPIVKSDSAAR